MKKSKSSRTGHRPVSKAAKASPENRDNCSVELDALRTSRPDLAKLYEHAERVFSILENAAKSDLGACRVLVRLLHDHIYELNRVDESNPHLRQIARETPAWPILTDPHPKSLQAVKSKLDRLGVGEANGYHIRQYAPVTAYALKLVDEFIHRREELLLARSTERTHGTKHDYSPLHPWEHGLEKEPPLTKSNFPKWQPRFVAVINEHRKEILDNPDLRQLGNTRTAAERPTAAFAEIRQAILRAVQRILNDPSPVK